MIIPYKQRFTPTDVFFYNLQLVLSESATEWRVGLAAQTVYPIMDKIRGTQSVVDVKQGDYMVDADTHVDVYDVQSGKSKGKIRKH